MKRIIILCIVTMISACTFTSKYSKPYSAKKVASILEKYYGIKIELVEEKIINRSPFAEMQYIYKDINKEFYFTVKSAVEKDPHFPVVHRNIYDNYQTALMFHYREQAVKLSVNYGLKFIPVENIQQNPIDEIYISEPKQLINVAELFFRLKELYNHKYPERDNRVQSYHNRMKLSLYYLPEKNNNLEEAEWIWNYEYKEYTDKDNLYDNLKRWWNEKRTNNKMY